MLTQNIYIIFFIVHSLCMHTVIKGMNDTEKGDESESIQTVKYFYIDDLERRRGIYKEIRPLSENKQNEQVIHQYVKEEDKIAYIYFTGFGETVDKEHPRPVFPDCALQFKNAAFYTKQNIIIAAQYLKQKIAQGYNVFHLEGKSAGAGILINCLHALVNYNSDFFKNTNITEDDAHKIIEAVNKGKIALSTPLLSMEKTCIVAFASQCASYTTILSICGLLAYKKWFFADALRNNRNVQIFGFFAASILMISLCGRSLENMFSKAIDRYIIPIVTSRNYDSRYIKLDAAAYYLAPHLHCQVLIHCSRADEILKNDKDIAKFHHAFHFRNNTASTYFLLSDGDTHATNNLHYKEVSHNFFNLNQESFTKFCLNKQYSISHSFKDRTLLLQDNSRVAKEIADLKRNSISEFFSLGYSVFQSLGRLT